MSTFWEKWLLRILVSIGLIALGVFLRSLMPLERCPACLPMPKLPAAYQTYDIHLLDDWRSALERNYHIQKFYQAWKHNETYAICDQGVGIDTYISIFWITDQGKITRIFVDHLNFTGVGKKLYNIDEVKSISVRSWVYEGDSSEQNVKVEMDPNRIMPMDLFIKADKNSSGPDSTRQKFMM